MEHIKLSFEKSLSFVSKEEIFKFKEESKKHVTALREGTGKGNDYVGWVDLPSKITEEELNDIEATALSLKEKVEVLVVIGIGGSYLGAKAVNDALAHSFDQLNIDNENPLVLYAGQNISEDYLFELMDILKDLEFGICVISKSGTTTEPAIAFRLLKELLEENVGKEEARERIIAITDASKGALRTLAVQEGYKTFVIPDDVGGRFSVLTPVGLLPIAVAGNDIKQLVKGAKSMQEYALSTPFEENPALLYAATRNALYAKGKGIEILANYNPKLHNVAEWWKQLYGESEGKENKGIFPASVDFTSDLHSMGQYIQEGQRNIFETVISIAKPNHTVFIPEDKDNLDKLNFLAGRRIDAVNKMAELGTQLAHVDGGVPNLRIEMPQLNEFFLGELLYFFEIACGVSGYILDVNPFDQPGVEAYKSNMFALLEKPGFEEETKKIKERL
ncbi:glucose-6-phosphate isomerase [Labilibaculum filiforme]|uniref:Glucose-6-phosphate isomerase n=1 Tax=Labilibaculum filiforme TaxID=1940526 RepID=A0A2N3I6B4_9BACT|nr:glucose-6-phosphate isomerase [Labilibaculum filiforme]PKQ65858.1 glucose-6-phosphate isomerase [Labilibaculum filiforme]